MNENIISAQVQNKIKKKETKAERLLAMLLGLVNFSFILYKTPTTYTY